MKEKVLRLVSKGIQVYLATISDSGSLVPAWWINREHAFLRHGFDLYPKAWLGESLLTRATFAGFQHPVALNIGEHPARCEAGDRPPNR